MIRINLLPRRPARRPAGRRLLEIGLPLAAIVVLALTWVVLSNQVANRQRALVDINQQIAELQPQVAHVQDLQRQIAEARKKEDLLSALLATQLPASSIMNNIRVLVPKDVWITSLSVPDTASFTLEGFALAFVTVARLMDNLESSSLFEAVDLNGVERDKIGAREVVKFQVNGKLVRPSAVPEGAP